MWIIQITQDNRDNLSLPSPSRIIATTASFPYAIYLGNGNPITGYQRIGQDTNIVLGAIHDRAEDAVYNLQINHPNAVATAGEILNYADRNFATPVNNLLTAPIIATVNGVNYVADNIAEQENYLANNRLNGDFWTGAGVGVIASRGAGNRVSAIIDSTAAARTDIIRGEIARGSEGLSSGGVGNNGSTREIIIHPFSEGDAYYY